MRFGRARGYAPANEARSPDRAPGCGVWWCGCRAAGSPGRRRWQRQRIGDGASERGAACELRVSSDVRRGADTGVRPRRGPGAVRVCGGDLFVPGPRALRGSGAASHVASVDLRAPAHAVSGRRYAVPRRRDVSRRSVRVGARTRVPSGQVALRRDAAAAVSRLRVPYLAPVRHRRSSTAEPAREHGSESAKAAHRHRVANDDRQGGHPEPKRPRRESAALLRHSCLQSDRPRGVTPATEIRTSPREATRSTKDVLLRAMARGLNLPVAP
jgi:hypothetical protein